MQQGIKCPNCGFANSPGQKFCGNCGGSIVSPAGNTCPNCGTSLKPGDKFCGNCGAQIPATPVMPQGGGWRPAQQQNYGQQQEYAAPPPPPPQQQAQTWNQPGASYDTAWGGASRRQSSMPLLILLVVLLIGLGGFGWWAFFGNPPWSGGAGLLVTKGPFISVPGEQTGSTRDVSIIWESNKETVGMVEYGTGEDYGQLSIWGSAYVTEHSIDITSLQPDTRYHYRVIIKDKDDTEFRTGDFTFKTPQ
ncbi:MAG TPA: zinc-ribbon domain-containing protein [Dehalococcoidia bacterium]|nr:zinc-ribbon domain-containing protein [Dehalococcoidia bacterium]